MVPIKTERKDVLMKQSDTIQSDNAGMCVIKRHLMIKLLMKLKTAIHNEALALNGAAFIIRKSMYSQS